MGIPHTPHPVLNRYVFQSRSVIVSVRFLILHLFFSFLAKINLQPGAARHSAPHAVRGVHVVGRVLRVQHHVDASVRPPHEHVLVALPGCSGARQRMCVSWARGYALVCMRAPLLGQALLVPEAVPPILYDIHDMHSFGRVCNMHGTHRAGLRTAERA